MIELAVEIIGYLSNGCFLGSGPSLSCLLEAVTPPRSVAPKPKCEPTTGSEHSDWGRERQL